MSTKASTTDGRRKRGTLTRDEILDAAAALLEEEGLDGLTMAGVAKRVGVVAMSLYAHVESKADLLLALYRRSAERAELPTRDPAHSWEDWLAELFSRQRREALVHPELGREVSLLYARNAAKGPVGLSPGGDILGELVGAGFSEENATRAYVTINTFVTGFVLWEIDRFHTQTPDDYRRDYLRRLAEADEPPTQASWTMLAVLIEQPIDELFEAALRAVITGAKAQFLEGSAVDDSVEHVRAASHEDPRGAAG